jgi:protein ImuA
MPPVVLVSPVPAPAASPPQPPARPVHDSLRANLWRADQLMAPALPACPSGFAALDAELPGGGWPAAGLTELLLREAGSGELRLLAPALQQMAEGSRELVWVAPPHPPYAPAVQALGLPLERLVWLQPAGEADAAWAAEQVLRSASAAAVLWWSRESPPTTLRRLHLAAQDGCTPLFALRPAGCRSQSSPAPLRVALEPAPAGCIRVEPFKRRGPALAQALVLSLADRPQPALSPPRSLVLADVVAGPAPALVAA